MSQVEHIGLLLKDLETVLKAGGYWSSTAPAPEALQSTQPFARDTLAFEAWLQFIFIPRFQQLIASGQSLPASMALLPMAQIALPGEVDLHLVLQQLDEVVCGK